MRAGAKIILGGMENMAKGRLLSRMLGVYFISTALFLAAIGEGILPARDGIFNKKRENTETPASEQRSTQEQTQGDEAAAGSGNEAEGGGQDAATDGIEERKGDDKKGFSLSPTELGVLCVSAQYPALSLKILDSRDADATGTAAQSSGEGNGQTDGSLQGGEAQQNDTPVTQAGDGDDGSSTGEQSPPAVVVSGGASQVTAKEGDNILYGDKPRVLIVHTHGTESYMPSNESNFHKLAKENTVRDVGQVMAETLAKNGVQVLHNETIHDNPSYNSAYARSGGTIKAILAKYPSIECVIDLHRDAAGSGAASPAKVVSVNGKRCGVYSYVVSSTVGNYGSNAALISRLNAIASSEYGGFTGKTIMRQYGYNQNLCKNGLLVEIGFTMNTIEESRNTAAIFGEILAKALK